MMKCTATRIPYSRRKLTYENEAVFFAYSYITTNSQTRANKLAILLGPGVIVTSQQTDGSSLGTPLLLFFLLPQLRLPAGLLRVRGEAQEEGLVTLPCGT